MWRVLILCVMVAVLCPAVTQADQIGVEWAGAVVPGPNPPNNPANALGRPDGLQADFSPDGASAEYSQFQGLEYFDRAAFAALLGVPVDLIRQGSIIVFEGNGTADVGFERSGWRFASGGVEEVLAIPGDAVATGAITPSDYAAFFGAPVLPIAEWPFVVLELNTVDPLASDLAVTVTREDPPNGTPDPDGIGIIRELQIVPVQPSTWGGIKSLYRE